VANSRRSFIKAGKTAATTVGIAEWIASKILGRYASQSRTRIGRDLNVGMPKPGDFPIGSVESRAAMRLQLVNRRDVRKRVEFQTNVFFEPGQDGMRFHFYPWLRKT
jgi:hypothetical protein